MYTITIYVLNQYGETEQETHVSNKSVRGTRRAATGWMHDG